MAVLRSIASDGIGKDPGIARGRVSYGISIGSLKTTFFSRGFRGLPASLFLLPVGLPGLRFGIMSSSLTSITGSTIVTGSSSFVIGNS